MGEDVGTLALGGIVMIGRWGKRKVFWIVFILAVRGSREDRLV